MNLLIEHVDVIKFPELNYIHAGLNIFMLD